MSSIIRRSLWVLPSALLLALLPGTAGGQQYPAKPIRIIVASSAGSNPDTVARILANGLTQALGHQIIVEDRAGAGGNIGAEAAARAPADGYNVFYAHTNHIINPGLYKKLNYDILGDFAPVSLLATSSFVAAVHPSLPVKSVRDLLALAKAKPGGLNCASAGLGSSTHMAFELFRALSGVKITHVPYKGPGPALVDTMAGQVHMLFGNVLSTLTHVKAGRLRGLAVTTAKRSKVVPDLPTIAESGVPAYENSTWHGWIAPAGTPPAIVTRLNAELVKAAHSPDLADKLAADGGEGVSTTPEQFARVISTETVRWGKVIKEAGITLEQ